MIRKNYYIFVERIDNFKLSMRHLVYGAKLSRPEHHALGNVKAEDILFIYVMDERALYGPFIAKQRAFEDVTDLGWTRNTKKADWPHRVSYEPWSVKIGKLHGSALIRLFADLKGVMFTVRDISDFHQRYLNSLLYEEGVALFKGFIETCEWYSPNDIVSDFGLTPCFKDEINARTLLMERKGRIPEYIIELYLLQNLSSLKGLVGAGITDIYNQVYVYQNKFLDILTLHRIGDEVVKASVIEIKARARSGLPR